MGERMEELLFLQPVFKQMIWGGERLATEFGYEIPGKDTGECWGIGAHPNGDCTVREGRFKGKTLSWLWKNEPELFGKSSVTGVFPLLTKIIDAKADLSIQVHPSDDYAETHENGSLGKTECWYILDCPEDAELVVGHNAKNKAECADMIRQGRWDRFIRRVSVCKGDFISIAPGTVHAIKAGILLLETQRNSDITYRVYDYDRLSGGKKRELHVEKSMDVIEAPARPAKECIRNFAETEKNRPVLMEKNRYYSVWKLVVNNPPADTAVSGAATALSIDKELSIDKALSVDEELSMDKDFDGSAYLLMSVIGGSGTLNERPLKKGDHFIVPAGFGKMKFVGDMELIISAERGAL